MKQTPILIAQDISKSYGANIALQDVSFNLLPGSILAIIGPNGSGKTTLLKSLIGLVSPDAGSVELAGLDPATTPYEVRRKVAFVPDEDDVLDWVTPREYLHFVAALYGVDKDTAKQRVADSLEMFDLTRFGNQICGGFSHGMRKKVQIAAALMSAAKVIIIDEPTNGLDPDMIQLVAELLEQMKAQGYAIIVATHHLDFAAKLANSILVLRNRSFAVDSLAAILRQTKTDNLDQAYRKLTGVADHGVQISHFLARN